VVNRPSTRTPKSLAIALVVDERLTRDRRGGLSRVVNSLRQFANVQIIAGETDEEKLLARIQKERFDLVLAPWYNYLKWSKLEAHYGLTRSSGPTVAGYFCEPIDPHELGEITSNLRAMLFDFSETHPHEAGILVKALVDESKRSGIRPLLDPTSMVYCETWYQGQGMGGRTDAVLGLPELALGGWVPRAAAIRVVLGALWSLVYEEGTGKSELSQALSGGKQTARAYMQVGCDNKALVFRLCYSLPSSSAKNALASFWPDSSRPTVASQLLLKFADFIRVHTVADGQEIELTTGFFQSAASEKAHRRLHSFWIEPISASLISEIPFEIPGPDSHLLKELPVVFGLRGKPDAGPGNLDKDSRDKFVFEAAVKIRELKKQLTERDERIQELRSGGVGTAPPLPPPDAEALIEAFQQKYFEARHQIRQFELTIAEMEVKGATTQEIEALRLKMTALARREEDWIRKLAKTLHSYRNVRKAAAGGGGG
jgi:hypothetical protein